MLEGGRVLALLPAVVSQALTSNCASHLSLTQLDMHNASDVLKYAHDFTQGRDAGGKKPL